MSTLALRRPVEKPAPWPYKEKCYTRWHWYYDFTNKRLDENSKLIVVEGNIACGKHQVAKEIANEFGFHHIPCPTMDKMLINMYGSDMRNCYDLLPERFRFFDLSRFYQDPYHVNVAQFFYFMLQLKAECYQNALAHILNTGQGVVLENSVLSDYVFVEAAYKKGCISKDFYDYYIDCRDIGEQSLVMWPHLIVYMDTPASVCLENIQKRNIPYEVNSSILDLEYLKTIEDAYKKRFLTKWDEFSATAIYDWTVPGDVEGIIEDIENMDLGDEFDWHRGDRFESWHTYSSRAMDTIRLEMTRRDCTKYFGVDVYHIAELLYHPEDMAVAQAVLDQHHWGKYEASWNPDKDGWWNLLTDLRIFDTFTTLRNKNWVEHDFADMASQMFGNRYNRN